MAQEEPGHISRFLCNDKHNALPTPAGHVDMRIQEDTGRQAVATPIVFPLPLTLLTLMTGIQTLLDLEALPLQVRPTSLFLILTSLPSPGIYISPERVNTLEASSLNTPRLQGHSGKHGALTIAGTCCTLFFPLFSPLPQLENVN